MLYIYINNCLCYTLREWNKYEWWFNRRVSLIDGRYGRKSRSSQRISWKETFIDTTEDKEVWGSRNLFWTNRRECSLIVIICLFDYRYPVGIILCEVFTSNLMSEQHRSCLLATNEHSHFYLRALRHCKWLRSDFSVNYPTKMRRACENSLNTSIQIVEVGHLESFIWTFSVCSWGNDHRQYDNVLLGKIWTNTKTVWTSDITCFIS